jgi:hypothetical protein
VVVPLVRARDEDLVAALAVQPGDAFGFVLVEGTVLKETTLASSSALELFGPGDVLAPPLSATRQLDFPSASRYLALGDVSVATLGPRFKGTPRHLGVNPGLVGLWCSDVSAVPAVPASGA